MSWHFPQGQLEGLKFPSRKSPALRRAKNRKVFRSKGNSKRRKQERSKRGNIEMNGSERKESSTDVFIKNSEVRRKRETRARRARRVQSFVLVSSGLAL